jgi:hypothetical protein
MPYEDETGLEYRLMELFIFGAIVSLISFLLGVVFTPYLRGYSTKKGENLATHEDIDKVVDQVKAVTETTKQIEKRVSEEVWDRQKRWELRRDVLFEMARKAGHEMEAVSRLHAIYTTEKINEGKGLPPRLDRRTEVGAAWNNAAAEFEGMIIVVSASCGMELAKALLDFGMFMRSLSLEIIEGKPEAFMTKAKEMAGKSKTITDAIRKELEIPITL